jgi:large subunit ribosomal protein L32
MAVPKQRKTKSRRNQRRSHIFLKAPALGVCVKCGKPVTPHTVCQNCGYYKGKMVIDVMKKLDKKEKKLKEKEIAAKEGETQKTQESLSMENLSKK